MNTDKKITVFVMTIIMLIVAALCFGAFLVGKCSAESADLPEYADLTFIDMADLDAQVDSVLDICQTDSMVLGSEWNNVTGEIRDSYYYWQACRRFTGLTMFWMPGQHRPGIWMNQLNKGKARLWWWEEVKQ